MAKRYLLFVSERYSLEILRPVQKIIHARGDEAGWFFDGPGREYLINGEKSLDSVQEAVNFNPDCVFAPGNWVPDFFPGIKVELFHGFHAFKRSDKRGHFRIRGFFDLYCTQGPGTTIPFKKLAEKHRHFEVSETGWPKMDPLFDSSISKLLRADRPVVLYTSTFTPSISSAVTLYPTIKDLSAKGRWMWLVNFHPKMDRRIVQMYRDLEGDNLRFFETDAVVPLLKSADVMLSDTSSIISEFLLQRRPVVTFRNKKPGKHLIDVTSTGDIEKTLEFALGRPQEILKALTEYGDWIHPYRDGRSSERVLKAADSLIERGTEHLGRKPLNLLRRYKVRQRLFWHKRL